MNRRKLTEWLVLLVLAAAVLTAAYLLFRAHPSPSEINHKLELEKSQPYVYHHRCRDSALCPQFNDTAFKSYNTPGSDAYIFDSLHFAHPLWDYKQTEDSVFARPDNTTQRINFEVTVVKDSLYIIDNHGFEVTVKYH